MRTRAKRRFTDRHKALRKRRIVNNIYRWSEGWYDNLHQYSKNKIHCSCQMCQSKTNPKVGSMNWPVSDIRHQKDMDQQMDDYYEGEPYEDECDKD